MEQFGAENIACLRAGKNVACVFAEARYGFVFVTSVAAVTLGVAMTASAVMLPWTTHA